VGGLARWLRRGRSNREGVFDGAKREGGRTPGLVGIAGACRSRASGVLVQFLIVSRRPRHPPLRKHRGVAGPAAVVGLGAVVLVVVHSATGGVADVTPTERARRAESSTWLSTPPRAEWLTLPWRVGGRVADREPLPPPLPVAKHRGVEGAAAVVAV